MQLWLTILLTNVHITYMHIEAPMQENVCIVIYVQTYIDEHIV